MANVSSSTDFINPSHKPIVGQPAWDVALLYPLQGYWSECEYLMLTEGSSKLVELTDGHIKVLTMPTSSHQRILLYLYTQLHAFISPGKLGEALCSPLRMRLAPGRFREPDIVFMRSEHRDRVGESHWEGADLVMEVVSLDAESRKRDLIQKPVDYAQGGIPEYWIVDPEEGKITVLTLDGDKYVEHGVFGAGQQATSKLLDGFVVDVAAVFAAAKV